MATTRMRLAQDVQAMDGAQFHELCDRLMPLVNSEYTGIQPYGRLSAAAKSRKGQPDSYKRDQSGRFIAFQYTTSKSSGQGKLTNDVEVLSNPDRCKIHDRISRVVLCCASEIPPHILDECHSAASERKWSIDVFGLDRLCAEIEKHPQAAQGLLDISGMTPEVPSIVLVRCDFGSPGRSDGWPEPPRFRAKLQVGNPSDLPWTVSEVTVSQYMVNTGLLSEPVGHIWWRAGQRLKGSQLALGPKTMEQVELGIQVKFAVDTLRQLAEAMACLSDYSLTVVLRLMSAAGDSEAVTLELKGTFQDFFTEIVGNYWGKGVSPELATIANQKRHN